MRTLNQALRIGVEKGEDAETCLHQFLNVYLQTPHSTTCCAQSHLLLRLAPRDTEMDGEAALARREATNRKASLARRAQPSSLCVGDYVVVNDKHWAGSS